MNPDTTNIIVGPPGTGKTHKLLSIVELLLEDGVSGNEIGFIAFTRKAANEAKQRACEKFRMDPDKLRWFRTLHSLAFSQLAIAKHNVMGFGDYLKIAQLLGLVITFKGVHEDGTMTGLSKGDRLFFMENMARAVRQPLRDYWGDRPDEDIYWYELEQLQTTLLKYKWDNGKVDFTDMVIQFIKTPVVPELKALIIDEAQDLTPLQWDMAEIIADRVDETYIAGDDDQAIFRWAGADIERFINLPGSREVLPQSYRVPVFVQGVAERVVNRIKNRIPKQWMPTKEIGGAEWVTDLATIDMSQGTWLLLARNVFLLQQYNEFCTQEGLVFSSHLGSPIKGTSMTAIRAWEALRKGETVKIADAKVIYDFLSSGSRVERGFKKQMDAAPDEADVSLQALKAHYGLRVDFIWHEALDRIPMEEREYFLAALRRGEKLLREPRIKIETIHGVKGGEADNVVLCVDMAERTWREYEQNPDDEHRVWYVGITRARKKLFVLPPETNKYYDI